MSDPSALDTALDYVLSQGKDSFRLYYGHARIAAISGWEYETIDGESATHKTDWRDIVKPTEEENLELPDLVDFCTSTGS
jgi:hypothetical protein